MVLFDLVQLADFRWEGTFLACVETALYFFFVCQLCCDRRKTFEENKRNVRFLVSHDLLGISPNSGYTSEENR